MTDEEYVIILKNCASMLADGIKYMKEEQKKQFKEAYEKAIEALSAEPCEDAVSREAVLELTKYISEDYSRERDSFRYFLEKLPSVKVEPQTAEWIDEADKIDAKFGRHDYVCPKCNEYARRFVGGSEDWWCVGKPNYCPNCGAKMKGEKE